MYKQLVSIYDPTKTYDGYTLFAHMGSRYTYLVDMKGRFVHRWYTPYIAGLESKLLPNGHMLVCQRPPTGGTIDMPGGASHLLELDWDSNVVWKYEDQYLDAHDFERMENGNTLIARWMPVPSDITAKVKGGMPGTEREGIMWADCFREITPDGKVVWEWRSHEHMDFETDVLCPLCSRATCTHANSLVILSDGNILTCFRVTNTIAIINKTTGNIIWRWGPGELGHPHNPTLLDSGNILIFDNGLHRPILTGGFSYSRVLEVDMKTKEIKWEYKAENRLSFYASNCASAQRLANGNTLICEATKGRIFEVTPEKEIVWEFTSPFFSTYRYDFGLHNLVYRARRYGPDYPGLRGKSLDPDRFEWVLQEKGKPATEEVSAEEEASRRLGKLGY